MNTLMQNSGPLVEALSGFLVMLILYAIGQGTRYIQSKVKNDNVSAGMDRLQVFVTTMVKATEQTMVADLKDALKDGKFDEAEKLRAKKKVFDAVVTLGGGLGQIAKDVGMKELDRVKALIEGMIEASVLDLKAKTVVDTTINTLVRSDEVVG